MGTRRITGAGSEGEDVMGRRKKAKVDCEWPVFWPEFELSGMLPDEPEWERAWDRLALMSGDRDRMAEDRVSGECWEYLCSIRYPDDPELGWLHEFRHRWHPRLQRRWVLHVPASPGWSPRRAPHEADAAATG